jgi:macrodomain Ter protein organizer (MatP/YcbG family)
MSNQTKLLDDILYQELRPWLGKNSLDQKYASKLSSVKEASTDFQFKYEINFHRPFDHKTKYYSKLILNNVKAECVRLVELIKEDNNENLIKYWLEDTLNKRIKTRLKDLGKLIKEKDYALTYIDPKKTSFELNQTHKANTFILQLLKLAYMQLYLEIQNAFSTWIDDQFILEDFYSQLLLEPVPDKHFLKPVQVIEVESKPVPAAKTESTATVNSFHSFTYKQLPTNPDKLTDLWDSLKLNHFISKSTTLLNFKKVFSGGEIKTPIEWTGNISELFYSLS